MSTAIPDTHPLAPGFYQIEVEGEHLSADASGTVINATNQSGDVLNKIFRLSLWGTGYKIEHFATSRYAYAPALVETAVIEVGANPMMWNIQGAGEGTFHVVAPEKDFLWTWVDVWNIHIIRLYPASGESDQVFRFKRFVGN